MDRAFIEHSEGARLVVEYCEELADELNLDLVKSPYWVLPISGAAMIKEASDLIIDSELGSVKVIITRKQLENYPAGVSKEIIDKKIIDALNSIR